MEDSREEHIIKNLIYEKSARDYLKGMDQERQFNVPFLRLAAILIILLMAMAGIYLSKNSDIDHENITAKVYEFPPLSKSRSAEVFIVDQYIDEIKNKDYNNVLEALITDELKEKDAFYKAHLLFESGQYQNVVTLLTNQEWQDDYFKEESLWLLFLAEYNLNYKKSKLKKRKEQLPFRYQENAQFVIESMKH